MEFREAQLKDFFVRDASETHYSVGGTLVLGFWEGIRYSKVEVGASLLLLKDTPFESARDEVLQHLKKLLDQAGSVPIDQIVEKVVERDRR